MASRHVYLIRHGQQDHHCLADDELESGLSTLGRQQAERVARCLEHLPISSIRCSPMRRALETAIIIAKKHPSVPLNTSPLLAECIPSNPKAYGRDKDFERLPSEELEECRSNLDRAFERWFKPARGADKHDVIVCHGNVIRYLVCRALDVRPHDAWARMDINNAGITRVVIEPSWHIYLLAHNDTCHLPESMKTFS